jgi:hypothetical protein
LGSRGLTLRGGLVCGLLHLANGLIGYGGYRLSDTTTRGAGSRLNRGRNNTSGGRSSLHHGSGNGGYRLSGLRRTTASLNNSRGNRSSDNRSLRRGGDGNGGGNLRSRSGNRHGNRGGHGGGNARVSLSSSLGDRRGSGRVLLRKLGDSLHVTSGRGLLDLLRELSGNRRILSNGERRGKRHKGGYDQGPSFHREIRRFLLSGSGRSRVDPTNYICRIKLRIVETERSTPRSAIEICKNMPPIRAREIMRMLAKKF